MSGQAQSCSKILNGKKYIQYSENFQGKLCFWRYRRSRYKRIQLYRTDLHEVSGFFGLN